MRSLTSEQWQDLRYSVAKACDDDDIYNEWLDALDDEYGVTTPRRPRKVDVVKRRRMPPKRRVA